MYAMLKGPGLVGRHRFGDRRFADRWTSGRLSSGISLLGFDRSPVSEIMMAIVIGMLIANTGVVCRQAFEFWPKVLCQHRASRWHHAARHTAEFVRGWQVHARCAPVRRFGDCNRPLLTIQTSRSIHRVVVAAQWADCRGHQHLRSDGNRCYRTAHQGERNGSELRDCLYHVVRVSRDVCVSVSRAVAISGPTCALAGLFLGTSIHETAQVAGAGLMYEEQYNAPLALETATVTKLVRNLCMIAVIPLGGFPVRRRAS